MVCYSFVVCTSQRQKYIIWVLHFPQSSFKLLYLTLKELSCNVGHVWGLSNEAEVHHTTVPPPPNTELYAIVCLYSCHFLFYLCPFSCFRDAWWRCCTLTCGNVTSHMFGRPKESCPATSKRLCCIVESVFRHTAVPWKYSNKWTRFVPSERRWHRHMTLPSIKLAWKLCLIRYTDLSYFLVPVSVCVSTYTTVA